MRRNPASIREQMDRRLSPHPLSDGEWDYFSDRYVGEDFNPDLGRYVEPLVGIVRTGREVREQVDSKPSSSRPLSDGEWDDLVGERHVAEVIDTDFDEDVEGLVRMVRTRRATCGGLRRRAPQPRDADLSPALAALRRSRAPSRESTISWVAVPTRGSRHGGVHR